MIAMNFYRCALLFALLSFSTAKADVLTQRYNNERTGSVSQSSINQSTVSNPRWGLIGKLPVTGTVYAQPLVVEDLGFGSSSTHDLVFVATARNMVHAFDAHSLAPLWSVTLPGNDKSKMNSPGCDGISIADGIGIEATPVIDRTAGLLYVSYRVNSSSSDPIKAEQRLRAIDLRTGATRHDVRLLPPNAPADWTVWHRNRAGLLLSNGVVYVAFASRCEDPGKPLFHGWILAQDAATLRPVGAFETTPNTPAGTTIDGGGIWQGAVGLAADSNGAIYATTGNRRPAGFPDNSPWDTPNLADSFVKLSPNITRATDGSVKSVDLKLTDWFTPYRKVWLDENDLDMASAGPVVIPNSPYIMGGGKSGLVYILDRNNMGRLDTAHAWGFAQLNKVPQDAIDTEWPDNSRADHVVQKFQAATNQYVPVGSPYLPHAGAPVATIMQTAGQNDLFAMGRGGALWVYWENGGVWSDGTSGRSGPAAITPAHFAPPLAHVATTPQNANQLDAFLVGNDGAGYVTWEDNNGRWADGGPGQPGPARITPAGLAPPGSSIALANQTASQLDAFVVGNDGAGYVTWEINNGRWADGSPGAPSPARITPLHFAPAGAGIAAIKQNDNQLDAFVVANNGAVHVTWEDNNGRWTDGSPGINGPVAITPVNFVPPGAPIAVAKQNANQLDAFFVGNDGAVYVTWEDNNGRWTEGAPGHQGPVRITPAGLAPKGACVAAAFQTDQQLNVFVVGNDGAIYVTWSISGGPWTDGTPGHSSPARVTPQGQAIAGSCPTVLKPDAKTMNAFVTGIDGTLWLTSESSNGPWWDGLAGHKWPVGLSQAIWMRRCWPCWPHIHGSPIFASFKGGRSMIYVWPEKDHLKAIPWLGNNHADSVHRVFATDRNNKVLVAPPGPPFGMPGGMLAVAVDTSRNDSGVLFASVPTPEGIQMSGILRAFDPITLRELWNNAGTDYHFVKFVPPTIAVGRVFLPSMNAVFVYGLR